VEKNKMLHPLFALLAICCGMAALICVCIWAKDTEGEVYSTYLGWPSWNDNHFNSYHPVLMVSGFYFAQVLGVCMWSVIPDYNIAKLFHAAFMLAAIGTLIAALYAVVSYEHNTYVPSLTSMHSWVGVMTVIIFGLQVIGGFVLGGLTAMGPVSETVKKIGMIHRAFGLASLFFTTVAVLTGIQNYLFGPKGIEANTSILGGGGGGGGGPISGPIYGYPVPAAYPYDDGGAYVDDFFGGSAGYAVFRGSCGYFIKNNENSNETPEKYFIHLPPACRLGFGVGVLVLLGTIFTALGVYTRALAIAEQGEVPAVSAPAGTGAPNYEMVEVPK
jgi:uncharacterized membrane protein YphA (DoxX/SURF4 family)